MNEFYVPTKIAPSVLSADFSKIKEEINCIQKSGADWVHLDVMDGQFVPVITFGPKFVGDIRPTTNLPFDVHLMIDKPENQIENFAKAGADYITFHIEASVHAHRIVQQIHALNCKAGISIVPSTPLSAIEELLPDLDLVLIMTVNPGYGGQKMIPNCLGKVERLKKLRKQNSQKFLIAIDGGVNSETFPMAKDKGVDVFIAGSAFFNAENKASFIKELKDYRVRE